MQSQAEILRSAHQPLAEWVRDTRREGDLLAVTDCGLIPYVAGSTVLDLWGLNEVEIAREGFSADVVFDRDPDLIVLVSRSKDRYRSVFRWEGELALDLAPDVQRFQVAVNDALLMAVVDRGADPAEQA